MIQQYVDELREIHYECKKTAKALNKNKIRSKLNKVVLFNLQYVPGLSLQEGKHFYF
jgi:hypothetical protein